ncbi:SusC/RagA family TonB-linked outer membrane protein [Mucilaginibacter psychrotolerans]|nr:SusC/RagA family TonB-linked outer membrane protein [Mucilaginibacter psychrotolerans]
MTAGLFSKAQNVTLKRTNAPISDYFKDIKRQTGYDFVYTSEILHNSKSLTIDVKKMPLGEALKLLFNNQPFSYQINSKTIIVIKKAEVSSASDDSPDQGNSLVHGRVYNEKNEPLSGATLRVLNGRLSAVTDESGNYVIIGPPADERLVVSYIGYKTDTVAIGGRNEIIFYLQPDIMSMKEVVVSTGLQTLSKERATGSFSKPDMEVFNLRTGTNDILQRLDGLIPGLTVLSGPTSDIPNKSGQSTKKVIVRGNTSINLDTQPLYVVNGIQVNDIGTINPNDVNDITVLKDASAAAIWGARAANGVIVINTKSGRRNQKIKVNYNAFINFQGKPDLNYQPRLNSAQFVQLGKELFNPTLYPYNSLSTSFIAPHEQILYDQNRGLITSAQATAGLDSLSRINNLDQIKKIWYRNAYTTNQTVSASGGGEAYSFYSSISYIDNHTNVLGASDKSYRINLNQSFNPTQRLRISLNALLANTDRYDANSISVGSNFLPYQLFKGADGSNLNLNYLQGLTPETRADYQARSRVNLDYNPLNELNSAFSKYNDLTANVTADVNLKLWKGFSYQGTFGYQKSKINNTQYSDISSYKVREQVVAFTVAPSTSSTPVYYLPNEGGKYVSIPTDLKNWTIRNQLIYNTNLRNGKDQFNFQIGQEAQEQKLASTASNVFGYNMDLQTYPLIDYIKLNNGVFGTVSSGRSVLGQVPFTSNETLTRFKSYFGLMNYTFDNKYSVDGSIRTDRSNLFSGAQSGQKKPAYSIGGKWYISREAFIKMPDWLNDVALRTTYGISGNSPYVGAAYLQDILIAENNSTTGNALNIDIPANQNLSWETTRTINIGLDFSILQQRISGSIDYYHKRTTDLLGGVPVNILNGTSSITGNLGNLHNQGVELNIRSVNVKGNNFTWSTNLTFGYNQNKFDESAGLQPYMLTDTYRLSSENVVGYSSTPLFAYRFAGLDNMGDPQIKLADGTITKSFNSAKAEDLVYMGTRTPKYNGGLTNTFLYKGLALTANMIYNFGAVMRRDVNQFYSGRLTGSAGGYYGNINPEFLDRWQKPGDELLTNIPSYVADPSENFRRNTQYYTLADINVVNASYIKLREITLSYNIPEATLRYLKISSASLFIQTGNYMIWKANKFDIDPEFQDFRNGGRGLPAYKHSFSIGANITF